MGAPNLNVAPKPQFKHRAKLILYRPHEEQLKLHQSPKRFNVAAFGRQSGKSTGALNHMLKCAWEKPNTKYWFISPTFPQARKMYRRLVGMLWKSRGVMIKKNQTELRIKLINNSEIVFVSGGVFEDLRGETLDGVVIDEVREQHPDLWPMVIRPMLATTMGWAWFISTPNGFDHFYDMSKYCEKDDDWGFFSAPSTANPLFTKEEAIAAQKSMTEAQYAQEILAEFRDLTSGKAYMSFGRHNHALECPFAAGKLWSPYHSVIMAPDFNLSPMAWNLGQVAADRWWWFDEIHLERSHTLEAAMVLRDRILIMIDGGFRATPHVIICGDATGKATQRSSNQSDYDILKAVLRAAGITFRDDTPEANPSIKDRVNAVNIKCRNARGETDLFVHPEKCPHLVTDLERVVWKVGADFTLDPGKKRERTHNSDGIGYAVHELTPVKAIRGTAVQKVLQRTL